MYMNTGLLGSTVKHFKNLISTCVNLLQFIVNVISPISAKMEAYVGNLVYHIYANVWKVSVVYYVKQVNDLLYVYMLLARVANYCCI